VGGSAGGTGGAGGGASAAGSLSLPGAKPNSGAAPPSVGVDGILITITQGNPAAAGAAIEASFRAANASALDAVSSSSPETLSKSGISGFTPDPNEIKKNVFEEWTLKDKGKEADVQNAINDIRRSSFGETKEGLKVVNLLQKKMEKGEIVIVGEGAPGHAHFNPANHKIGLELTNFEEPNNLRGILVHEGTHALDHSEFSGGRRSIAGEFRSRQNQVEFLAEVDNENAFVRDFYSRNRTENIDRLRGETRDAFGRKTLYSDYADSRYEPPSRAAPREPNRSDYPADKPMLFIEAKDNYYTEMRQFRRDFPQYEDYRREIEFERARQAEFNLAREDYNIRNNVSDNAIKFK
jgi:hypothetical protein